MLPQFVTVWDQNCSLGVPWERSLKTMAPVAPGLHPCTFPHCWSVLHPLSNHVAMSMTVSHIPESSHTITRPGSGLRDPGTYSSFTLQFTHTQCFKTYYCLFIHFMVFSDPKKVGCVRITSFILRVVLRNTSCWSSFLPGPGFPETVVFILLMWQSW